MTTGRCVTCYLGFESLMITIKGLSASLHESTRVINCVSIRITRFESLNPQNKDWLNLTRRGLG